MKIKLLIIISLFLGKTQGQNLPKSLTLNEAIEFGLSNNRSIINADREILKAKKRTLENYCNRFTPDKF